MQQILLLLCYLVCVVFLFVECDEGIYSNTIGAADGTVYRDLQFIKTIHMTVVIDGNPYSGSNNAISATFIGDFSSSGPTSLGPFTNPNKTYSISFPLDREIGQLVGIWVENSGYDSVLFSDIKCQIRELNYQIQIPRIWLETWNPSLITDDNDDGFSPDAGIHLNSSSTLYLSVNNTYFDYTPFGINLNPN